jgi:hypothetical protein
MNDSSMENTKTPGFPVRLSTWVGRHPYLFIAGVALLCMLPALILGLPMESDDGLSHRRWQLYFANQLWHGNVFPRWLIDLNDGFGSPAFFIYPPLSHYAAALFSPLLPGDPAIAYRLSMSILLSVVISGIGAYHWINQVVRERNAAIAGALIYLIAPYHLVVDIYIRGAMAEAWAFAWAPWTLLAIHMFGRRDRRAIPVYVISAAALLFSHAPSSLFLFFAYGAYAIFLAKNQKDSAILLYTIICTVTAILLAGIYLGTALTHTDYINTKALYEGYFNFFNWLMFSGVRWQSTKAEYSISGSAIVQTLAAVSLGMVALLLTKPKAPIRAMAWLSILGTLLLFFAMSAWSGVFWKILFPLQRIQFPWRLLMLQSLCLAMLAGCCMRVTADVNAPAKRKQVYALVAAIVLGFFLVNAALYVLTKKSIPATEIGSSETPEYRLGDTDKLRGLFPPDRKVAILDGQGEINVLAWTPRHLVVDVNALTPMHIAVRQFYYPGWEVRVGKSGIYRPVQQLDAERPVVSVNLEAGRQQLEFSLLPTPAEKAGTTASIVGCVMLALLMFFSSRHKKGLTDKNVERYSSTENA